MEEHEARSCSLRRRPLAAMLRAVPTGAAPVAPVLPSGVRLVGPLREALARPRVSLSIADDVGLGKTIRAGLLPQERLLRQRARRVLSPARPKKRWRCCVTFVTR